MPTKANDKPGSAGLTHWLTIREVIELTKLSRTMVYQLIGVGEMPSARVGRALRVDARSLAEWMASKSTSSR